MFKKILCPTDSSDHAIKALDLAIDLANKYDAALVILHVLHRSEDIEDLQRFSEVEGLAQHFRMETKRLQAMDNRVDLAMVSTIQDLQISPQLLVGVGEHILEVAKNHAEAKGVENVDARLVDGNPADRILRCIKDENIDCVIMGSRGLNDLKGLFLVSVSHKVANRAACTCIAVK